MSATPTPATGIQNAAGAISAAQGLMATSGQTNQGNAGGGGNGGGSGGTKVQAGFQLQMKKIEELKVETFDYSITAPETRTHAPNGFFSALVGGTEQATSIRTISLDDPFFKVWA